MDIEGRGALVFRGATGWIVVACVVVGSAGGAAAASTLLGRSSPRPTLSGALLTTSDLPDGWTTSLPTSDGDLVSEAAKPCARDIAEHATAKTGASFYESHLSEQLRQELAAFPSVDDAIQALNTFRSALEACDRWQVHENDATLVTYRAAPLPFATFGDETLAVQIDVQTSTNSDRRPMRSTGLLDLVVERRGSVLSLVVSGNLGALAPAGPDGGGLTSFTVIDSRETEQIVKRADEKLAQT